MVEVVLVGTAVLGFYDVEGCELGEDDVEESGALEVDETTAGMGRHDNLVELHLDTLATDYLDAVGHALKGSEGLILYLEIELGGKADAAHHAQRIVAEGDVGVEGCGDDAVLEVGETVEGVDEFAKAAVVEADGHGVDGEVATVLVVLEGAVLDDRFARVVAVALAAGTDELYL